MSGCLSPMRAAWYLKYDHFTLTDSQFLGDVEEIFNSLNLSIPYIKLAKIPNHTPNLNWVTPKTFSSNAFDNQLQDFIYKSLNTFIEFFRIEIFCVDDEEIHDNKALLLEKAFNFINLECFYCQVFWKSSISKPIPEFLRDRLFCSLIRMESFLIELHKAQVFKELMVFAGVLELIAGRLKGCLLELKELVDHYNDKFRYLLRMYNLLKGFLLFEQSKALENFLEETFGESEVKKLMQTLLEKLRNKNPYKQIKNGYNLLIEESFIDKTTENPKEEEFNENLRKKHSNSYENVQNNEEFEGFNFLSKKSSKTIDDLSKFDRLSLTQKQSPSTTSKKKFTLKSDTEDAEEEYGFINKLANSYVTTQIMTSQNYFSSILKTPPPENKEELSIISSKRLLRSPNLPFNSFLGQTLPETAIDESLGSKIVAGIKGLKGKSIVDSPIEKETKPNGFLDISTNSIGSRTLLKKNSSEIGEKLNQNLYNILISKDPSQIRNNIIIAKNQKNSFKVIPHVENNEVDDFFERRRKERIIHSNRASSIKETPEDFLAKNSLKEDKKLIEKSLEDSKKGYNSKDKVKLIEMVGVKEKDFIKINKMTEITEKLKATMFHENKSLEPFDEEIMEVSEEENEDDKGFIIKESLTNCFKGDFDEKNEEFSAFIGIRVPGLKRRNCMEFFNPLKVINDNSVDSVIGNEEKLIGENKNGLSYFQRGKPIKSTSDSIFWDIL